MKMNLCPHCQGWLTTQKKKCSSCGLQLEADFEESPLVMLAREEQDLIVEFVLAGGNFKALSEKLGLTYPTTRTYLDKIIHKLHVLSRSPTAEEILDAIERGEILPEDGIEKLRKLPRGGTP